MRKAPSIAAVLLACTAALLSVGASAAPKVDESKLLFVNYFSGCCARGETGWVTLINVGSDGPIARVTLTAPSTYPVRLAHAVGTRIGRVQAGVSAFRTASHVPAGGNLIVESPTRYAADPAAQACAPGAHTAVWRVVLARPASERGDPRLNLELPIFVDRGEDGGLVLHFCPLWRTSGGGMSAESLELWVEGGFGRLTASGWNTWHAFVSPPSPTLIPDAARAFEMRAHEPIPHRVTAHARHDGRKGVVVVSGRVTAVGAAESGVELGISALREGAGEVSGVGGATTNDAGEFSFRHRAAQSTVYIVHGSIEPRACDEPISAPAGCVSETVSAPAVAAASVRIRRPNEARLVVREGDQALADRIGLKRADLPRGWGEWSFFSGLRCRAFNPNLKRLTATGWSESGRFGLVDVAAAESRVTVYASEEQARIAFAREARLPAAQCLADELRREGLLGAPRPIEAPRVGDERRAFRIATRGWAGPSPSGRRTVDLLSFRRGRVVVHVGFEGVSARVQRAVVAKLAARARRG